MIYLVVKGTEVLPSDPGLQTPEGCFLLTNLGYNIFFVVYRWCLLQSDSFRLQMMRWYLCKNGSHYTRNTRRSVWEWTDHKSTYTTKTDSDDRKGVPSNDRWENPFFSNPLCQSTGGFNRPTLRSDTTNSVTGSLLEPHPKQQTGNTQDGKDRRHSVYEYRGTTSSRNRSPSPLLVLNLSTSYHTLPFVHNVETKSKKPGNIICISVFVVRHSAISYRVHLRGTREREGEEEVRREFQKGQLTGRVVKGSLTIGRDVSSF